MPDDALIRALREHIERLRVGKIPTFTLSFDPLTGREHEAYAIMRVEDVETFLNRRADDLAALLRRAGSAAVRAGSPPAERQAKMQRLLDEWDAEVKKHGLWTSGHSIAARIVAAVRARARPRPQRKQRCLRTTP